jgi:hypothetical protein
MWWHQLAECRSMNVCNCCKQLNINFRLHGSKLIYKVSIVEHTATRLFSSLNSPKIYTILRKPLNLLLTPLPKLLCVPTFCQIFSQRHDTPKRHDPISLLHLRHLRTQSRKKLRVRAIHGGVQHQVQDPSYNGIDVALEF